jgi:hypothetical protein
MRYEALPKPIRSRRQRAIRSSISTRLTVNRVWTGRRANDTVPAVKIIARWLNDLGFSQGRTFRVQGQPGRLVLTLEDFNDEAAEGND